MMKDVKHILLPVVVLLICSCAGDVKIVGESDTCETILSRYLNEVGMDGISTGRLRMLKTVELPQEEADGTPLAQAA